MDNKTIPINCTNKQSKTNKRRHKLQLRTPQQTNIWLQLQQQTPYLAQPGNNSKKHDKTGIPTQAFPNVIPQPM